MAINIYSSNDPGAPILNRNIGTMLAVLDFALVTGQGWTKPFEDIPNNTAVYRAPAGNQNYLRVVDNQNNFVNVNAFSSMSDVDTGLEAFSTAGNSNWFKTSLTTQVFEWYVIADDRGFYIITSPGSATTWNSGLTFYFGDYVPTNPAFTFNSILCSDIGTSTSVSQYDNFPVMSTNNTNKLLARDFSGIYTSEKHARWAQLFQSTALGVTSNNISLTYPNPSTNDLIVEKVNIMTLDIVDDYIGIMPGLLSPAHGFPFGTSGPGFFTGTGGLTGATYAYFPLTNGSIIIQTSGDWYA